MLTRLHVRNFAIVDEVEVELDAGMTVLTGETGAGKSILVDALGLVLGERGGAGLTRTGSRRAEFSAEFDVSEQPQVREWLAQQLLDADDECYLRRVIGEDGRSRAFVNGNTVPLTTLKALGEMLLDIHGQHFHQSLVRPAVQRDLLDHYGGLIAQREGVAAAFADWQALARRLEELEAAEADRGSRLDLLSFQAQELEALDLQPGEYDELRAERERFRHGAQLAEGVAGALQALSENDDANARALLAAAAHRLEAVAALDSRLDAARRLVEEAGIQAAEAADALQRYGESLDADPERRDRVEERLDAVQAIARKHRVEPAELPALRERLQRQLDELTDAEATGAKLRQEAGAAKTAFMKVAETLSAARRKAAGAFASEVTEAMRGLGMPEGVFEVELRRRDPGSAGPSGLDDVAYVISANAGQPPMPLAKVASGGELSRMSLAIQVIASDGSAIPTMVFDEVDAGVGGGVAEMVGRRLKGLGGARQVLCVTHLPQVAAQATCHLVVTKDQSKDRAVVSIAPIQANRKARVSELARMLGDRSARSAVAHAEELLGGAV